MRIHGILVLAGVLVLCSVDSSSGDGDEHFDRTGSSPEATARTLVHDGKFGMRMTEHAIRYGDSVIPHIRLESDDFNQLGYDNSLWLADVLGAIDSQLARETLRELYARKEITPRLVGAIGLGMQDLPPDIEEEGSFLLDAVVRPPSPVPTEIYTGYGATRRDTVNQHGNFWSWHGDLAIIALGYSKNEKALDRLHSILGDKPSRYSRHSNACQALARLHFEKKSIPVLRACLESPEFNALPDAFRALVCLGDKKAIPLAINRVGKDLEGTNSAYIIDELSRVTGRFYVYNKKRWSQWWDSVEDAWQIPERFIADWDAQPDVYSKVDPSVLFAR